MRTTSVDRMLVIWSAAALVFWTACLTILWGWAFDSSGLSTLLALSATMFAISIAAGLPGRAARGAQRVLAWLKLQDIPMMELAAARDFQAGRGRQGRTMMHLGGAVTLFAAGCGAVSTLAIWASKGIVTAMGRDFLWGPTAWTVFELLMQTLVMLPMAVGISVMFLAGTIIRGDGGRDAYASICRDWLWAIATGLAAFAVAWWAGVNLLGAAMMAALSLLVSALAFFQRRTVSLRPRRLRRPIETSPQYRRRLSIAAVFAAAAMVILVQNRILCDAVAVGLAGRTCWIAATAAMLAVLLRVFDGKSRPPGVAQGNGAAIGLIAGIVMQSALAGVALVGGESATIGVVLAAAVQVPAAALAAVVISRQRRIFAVCGGRARSYIASAAGGAGAGIAAFLIAGSLPASRVVLLVIAMSLCAVCVIAGIARARRPGDQLRWAASGAMLMSALAASMVISFSSVSRSIGRVSSGVWLSSVGRPGGSSHDLDEGVLPNPPKWRSGGVTDALADVLAGRPGKWLIAASSHHDLPAELPWGVDPVLCRPDRSAHPAVGPAGGDDCDLFRPGRVGWELFEGVVMAPLPADHPQAWRCYNEGVLRKCAARSREGVVVLRTQARRERLSSAMAVARTFSEVVGPSWAVIDFGGGYLDMLLAGPVQSVRVPRQRRGLFVIRLDRLWTHCREVRPIRIVNPPHLPPYSPSALRLRRWLRAAEGSGLIDHAQ